MARTKSPLHGFVVAALDRSAVLVDEEAAKAGRPVVKVAFGMLMAVVGAVVVVATGSYRAAQTISGLRNRCGWPPDG